MIPELGHVALILALQLALLQAVLSLAGASRDRAPWMAMGRGAALGQLPLVIAGFGALLHAFYTSDFSVLNVAEHSSRKLPGIYRLTAAWGSHEGSMLLWVLVLAGWTFAVALLTRGLPAAMAARVIGVMGLISAGLLAFVLFTSNPFLRLDPPPPDGMDLNPLLQDPGMVLHPPLLYMGYVGFSVAFAFALASLLSGRLDAAWARWSRPWTLVAWLFLTLGIAVGSWWAYVELGWGGWWFWDPTENASLMPWLAGTALVHSLAVTDQRGSLRVWTVLLAITAFSLSLVGTFLVRSGVLSSVHAFAQDPLRGAVILAFLVLVIGGSLALFGWRAPRIERGAAYGAVSRESALLAGNALLLATLGTVLLGTLYPLVLDALGQPKVSVGPQYFNAVFVPLMVPVLLLMGLAPHLIWREARIADALGRLRWVGLLALVAGGVLPLLATFRWPAAAGLALAAWIAGAMARWAWAAWRRASPLRPGEWGMALAHLGVAVGVAGIGLVSAYETESTVAMTQGETARIGGFTLTFQGVTELAGANYSAVRGTLEVQRGEQRLPALEPEKRLYHASKQTMTEAAIRYAPLGDLYVALGEPVKPGTWMVRLYHKPFVGWLWAGALLMALGAVLAALDRRYREAA